MTISLGQYFPCLLYTSLKVLQAAHISDDEYFSHMVLDDLNPVSYTHLGALSGTGAAALAADGALVEAAPSRGAAGYTLVSGYAWVTNDAVNLLSGIAVVALGLLVALP